MPFDVNELMQQAQAVQQKMQEAQERLAKKEVTGTAGGGMVIVTANGKGEILKVQIDRQAVDPRDVPMLEDLVLAAGAGEAGRRMKSEGRRIAISNEKSLVARAARTRQGAIANDVTLAPDFLPNLFPPFLVCSRSCAESSFYVRHVALF